MLKRIIPAILLTFIFSVSFSQGWRKGEMEVLVTIDQPADILKVRSVCQDFEPASTDGSQVRMYLVPEELKELQRTGLPFRITIGNMNRHFEHFWDNPLVPPGYYTYDQIIAIIDSLAANFPAICTKEVWGTSVGNRQLAALKISDNAAVDEPEPEIMFDGGIHGDEVGGSQNIIMFARDLCLAYGTDPVITDLVNTREIWLFPMVNPDGRVSMSRYNNNGVDCNRDFGYMWNAEGFSTGAFSQVESKTLRNAILKNQFVVYTNYHSGTEIISYPWSYRAAPSRDNAHINQLASIYASNSGYSSLLYGQGYNVMYAINGSTKDYQYGSLGNVGWSIEISMDKQPVSSLIGTYYMDNKPAMIQVISHCGFGISGMVTDSVTGLPVKASIWADNLFPVYNDPLVGDYHKYLIPGTYTLKIVANGYQTKTVTGVVVPSGGAAVTDIQLVPQTKSYAYKVISCRIPGNNFGDEGYTPGALGKPDSIPYSLGKNGWIILDMGDTIYNGTGPDFKVIQSGTTPKFFSVSGGNNVDGPFSIIGSGSGTTSFDMGSAGLQKVRYLYILDNSTGTAYGTGIGFNLDAVEILSLPVSAEFTSAGNIVCEKRTMDFMDLSLGSPTTWSWSFPGGIPSYSNAQNPGNIFYAVAGQYDVSLTVWNEFSTSTKFKPGYINVQHTPQVNIGNDTTVCAGLSVLLDAGNPGETYLWSTGATTQTIAVDSTGTGFGTANYWVLVRSFYDCQGKDTISVTFDDCTGTNNPVNLPLDLSVHPNPAIGHATLKITGFQGGTWQLISTTGTILRQEDIPLATYQTGLECGSLPRGIYTIRVQKGGVSKNCRLILLHSQGSRP